VGQKYINPNHGKKTKIKKSLISLEVKNKIAQIIFGA